MLQPKGSLLDCASHELLVPLGEAAPKVGHALEGSEQIGMKPRRNEIKFMGFRLRTNTAFAASTRKKTIARNMATYLSRSQIQETAANYSFCICTKQRRTTTSHFGARTLTAIEKVMHGKLMYWGSSQKSRNVCPATKGTGSRSAMDRLVSLMYTLLNG